MKDPRIEAEELLAVADAIASCLVQQNPDEARNILAQFKMDNFKAGMTRALEIVKANTKWEYGDVEQEIGEARDALKPEDL